MNIEKKKRIYKHLRAITSSSSSCIYKQRNRIIYNIIILYIALVILLLIIIIIVLSPWVPPRYAHHARILLLRRGRNENLKRVNRLRNDRTFSRWDHVHRKKKKTHCSAADINLTTSLRINTTMMFIPTSGWYEQISNIPPQKGDTKYPVF